MPLELLEYRVRRDVVLNPNQVKEWDLPDGPVPGGQTWKVDAITVAGLAQTGVAPPSDTSVLIYDQASPGAALAPVQATNMALLRASVPYNSSFAGFPVTAADLYGDIDSADSITLPAGNTLAILLPQSAFFYVFMIRVQYAVFQGVSGKPQPAAGIGPAATIPVGI